MLTELYSCDQAAQRAIQFGTGNKFVTAMINEEPAVTLWGSGRPRREFLCSDDLGEACAFLMRLPDAEFGKLVAPAQAPLINIGAGKDKPVAELAALVAEVVSYRGDFVYDASKPDGTPRKLLDSSRINALGWKPGIGLREGVSLAYADFLQRRGEGVHA